MLYCVAHRRYWGASLSLDFSLCELLIKHSRGCYLHGQQSIASAFIFLRLESASVYILFSLMCGGFDF